MMYYEIRYRWFAWVMLFVWTATLFMPLQSGELADNRQAIGLFAFLFGWLEHPAWFANIGFFFVSALLMTRSEPSRRESIAVAIISSALALSAFSWDNAIDEFQASQQFAVHHGMGFYLWIAVILAASVGLLARAFRLALWTSPRWRIGSVPTID